MATIMRAMRLKIYPTPEQTARIDSTLSACRYVYNHMLSRNNKVYRRRGKHLSYYDMQNLLPDMKGYTPWLKEADSQALKYACKQVDIAYGRFFKKLGGYPNFKSRRDSVQSYRTTNAKTIHYERGRVKIPIIGWIKVRDNRSLPKDANVCYATVSRDHGIYFVSITYKVDRIVLPIQVDAKNVIGLDYKSNGLYVDSNGVTADMPGYYRESERPLAKTQKCLSRKRGARKGERPSSNYKRQLKKLNKKARHVANQREDYLHKMSLAIAKEFDAVCIEDLNMRAMSNKGFGNGKATLDNGYGKFRWMLEYKLEERGKRLIEVDRFYPSSQLCSCCGARHPELKNLSIRRWICECGAVHDRDVNAAKNIKTEGLCVLLKTTA